MRRHGYVTADPVLPTATELLIRRAKQAVGLTVTFEDVREIVFSKVRAVIAWPAKAFRNAFKAIRSSPYLLALRGQRIERVYSEDSETLLGWTVRDGVRTFAMIERVYGFTHCHDRLTGRRWVIRKHVGDMEPAAEEQP